MFFSKVHPACHNIANGIKPGNDSKKTDKHAADWWRKVIYVRYMNCSYNIVAKGIRLLDKKAFLFIQEKFHASKSFWKIYPLNSRIYQPENSDVYWGEALFYDTACLTFTKLI